MLVVQFLRRLRDINMTSTHRFVCSKTLSSWSWHVMVMVIVVIGGSALVVVVVIVITTNFILISIIAKYD